MPGMSNENKNNLETPRAHDPLNTVVQTPASSSFTNDSSFQGSPEALQRQMEERQ